MLKNMKIGLRMGLSFGLILLFIIGLILIGLNAMKVINKEMETIVSIDNVRVQLANSMIDNARETAIDTRTMIICKFLKESDDSIKKVKNHITDIRSSYVNNVEKLSRLLTKDDVILNEQLTKVKATRMTAWQYQDQVFQLILQGKVNEGATFMVVKAYPHVKLWITEINDLIKLENESMHQRYNAAQKTYNSVRATMIILGIITFLLALTISILLTLGITRPLQGSVETASRIAANDLTYVGLQTERKDEVGELTQAFSKMIENLRQSVKNINEGVNLLSFSASEILAATSQVASGTAETSSALHETTTTVEEVLQAAKQSAQKAKNVADTAQRTLQVTQKGQKSVEESIAVMNRIQEQMDLITQTVVRLSEQNQSIGGIIASVTDIADQSNLLAVNAAIEAAKAGEQGKGFAVVAQEIRNLANQSKQSTLQVRNILNDVQKATSAAVMATEQGTKAVGAGVKKSLEAGEAIRLLAESNNDAVQATSQILASNQQQVIGMEQIGVAMQNINQVGTETAVSMVQSEKAAKNLHELGMKLKDMVDLFKV